MPVSIINHNDPETADVVFLGVGYDVTSSFGKGSDKGPGAVMSCLEKQVEFFERLSGTTPTDNLKIAYHDLGDLKHYAPEILADLVKEEYLKLFKQGKFVIVLGGEHSVSNGVFRAMAEKEKSGNITILQIDAHLDMRDTDADYNDTPFGKYAHSCVMRRAMELGFQTVHVGIRAYSKEEKDFADESEREIFEWGRGEVPSVQSIVEAIPTEKVYITFDVDGLDPSFMPGTGTPVPGGLDWNYFLKLLQAVAEKKKIIGLDVVEVIPNVSNNVTEFGAAQICYHVIGLTLRDKILNKISVPATLDSPRASFESLKLLDLRQARSVGEIVSAMNYCSFGARMLGEVAVTLRSWIEEGKQPVIIYDGRRNTPLGELLGRFVERGWAKRVLTPEEYVFEISLRGNVLVVGDFSERYEKDIFERPERVVFINQYGVARPGQVKDGYFPDAVFADPRFVMPVLEKTLEEWLLHRRVLAGELLSELGKYGGVAREVADGAETFRMMVEDPRCTVFLTLSGAMTIAKMGLVICDMIDLGMVNYIASTGALMAHGLVETVGLKHYKYSPKYDDALLAEERINRVTDTLEPEENFTQVADALDEVLNLIDGREAISPTMIHSIIGKHLHERYPEGRGILKSAYEKNVPIFVPAFIDSEIGNDIFVHNKHREKDGREKILVDMELDSAKLVKMATESERMGIFTVGGGVPRNNTQNVAPLVEIMNERLGINMPERKFMYGCRICPDAMHYGHLSGCTYSEGMSWRKMETSGRFSEIRADATQVWPFYVRYVMDGM